MIFRFEGEKKMNEIFPLVYFTHAELKEKEDKNNGSSVSADKIAGKDNS
jgi:hypothetical protein